MSTAVSEPKKQSKPERLLYALLVVGGAWGLGWFLQERAIFDPLIFVLLTMGAYLLQTLGHGIAMRTPRALEGLVASIKTALGPFAVLFRSGSRTWTFLQALAYGLVALLLQWVMTTVLIAWNVPTAVETFLGVINVASLLGTIAAVSVVGIALELLTRHLGIENTLADNVAGVLSELMKLAKLDPTKVSQNTRMVIGNVGRATLVQALRALFISFQSFFFHIGFGVFLLVVVLIAVMTPSETWKRLFPKTDEAPAETVEELTVMEPAPVVEVPAPQAPSPTFDSEAAYRAEMARRQAQ